MFYKSTCCDTWNFHHSLLIPFEGKKTFFIFENQLYRNSRWKIYFKNEFSWKVKKHAILPIKKLQMLRLGVNTIWNNLKLIVWPIWIIVNKLHMRYEFLQYSGIQKSSWNSTYCFIFSPILEGKNKYKLFNKFFVTHNETSQSIHAVQSATRKRL